MLPTSPEKPMLLVSVRNQAEAAIAMSCDVQIIDVKEPSHGALGMADKAVLAEIAQVVGKKLPLSVAMGELHELEAMEKLPWLPQETGFIKIGLAGEKGRDWSRRLRICHGRYPWAMPVAVAYWDASLVDAPDPQQVLDWAIEHHTAVLLIDTAVKAGPGLFASPADTQKLTSLIEQAREHDLPVALAGRLAGPTLEAAVKLAPAIIGVRTAACEHQQRGGKLCALAVNQVSQMLQQGHRLTHGRDAGE